MSEAFIDLGRVLEDMFGHGKIVVNDAMFGAISTSTSVNTGYGDHFRDYVNYTGASYIRWPGGTLAESGKVVTNGRISLTAVGNIPYAYDLSYPDLLHPSLLENGGGSGDLIGLSAMLKDAVENGSSFSLTLPSERYIIDYDAAYSDTSLFLRKLFVEKAFNNGELPQNITLDIGNEIYNPGSYARASTEILSAIRDFRADYPNIEFKVALQAMPNGSSSASLASFIAEFENQIGETNLIAEVDAIRIHNLKHGLTEIYDIEDRNQTYWSVRRLQSAILSAKDAEGMNSEPGSIDLYVSAWTTTSDDVQQGLVAGLPGASAVLSLFTGMLQLGADSAAAWGVAASSPATTSMSYIDSSGQQVLTAQGEVFRMMSENISGMNLLDTNGLTSGRSDEFNLYGFTSGNRQVFYVAANDLALDRLLVTLSLAGGSSISNVTITGVNTENGISGVPVISNRSVTYDSSSITFYLESDFDFVQVAVDQFVQVPTIQASNELNFSGQQQRVIVDLTNMTSNIAAAVSALSGISRLIGTDAGNNFTGNVQNNYLSGGSGSDVLKGLAGKDTIYGRSGNDIIWGGRDDDRLFGDAGHDKIYGDNGSDYIIGGTGSDELHGGLGDDTLFGNTGVDDLYGGDGNDVLQGGDGVDQLLGGRGNDYLIGNGGWDILWGGEGDDEMRGSTGADQLWGGGGNDWLFGGTGVDTLYGDDGQDILWGNEGADRLYGGAGNDALFGGSGNDLLTGETGNDTLYGGQGLDTLNGGEGDDFLRGGTLADTFEFTSGRDVIDDFRAVEDILRLDDALWSGTLTAQQVIDQYGTSIGDNYVLYFDNQNHLTFNGGVDPMILASVTEIF